MFITTVVFVTIPSSNHIKAEEAESSEEGSGSEKESKKDNGYDKKITKYNTYQSEIKTLKSSIQEEVKKLKKMKKDDPLRKELMARVVLLHDDLDQAIKKYNEIAGELKYQYPEKEDVSKRKYLPYRKQSLKQIEVELDLDDILTEAGKAVDSKYRVFLGEKTADEHELDRKSHKKKNNKNKKDERIEVSF